MSHGDRYSDFEAAEGSNVLRHEVFREWSTSHRQQVSIDRIASEVDCDMPIESESSSNDDRGSGTDWSIHSDSSYFPRSGGISSETGSDASLDREEETEKAAIVREASKNHAR